MAGRDARLLLSFQPLALSHNNKHVHRLTFGICVLHIKLMVHFLKVFIMNNYHTTCQRSLNDLNLEKQRYILTKTISFAPVLFHLNISPICNDNNVTFYEKA